MDKKSFYCGLVAGVLLAGATVVAAEKIGVTDVRVGPTAAISVTTSSDGQTVYIVNGNGLFKSLDGGANWRKLPVE